jgi:hypothetical protein
MRLIAPHALVVGLMIALGSAHAADAAPKKTVAEVHQEKDQLKDKAVQVMGQIVKVNNNVMGRNFIHLEDGTGSGATAKVIVTSEQTVNVGDKVVATGTVGRNVDFGSGYSYDLLIEKATVKIAGKH